MGEEELLLLLFFFLANRARFARLASSPMFSKRTKRKIKQRLCAGYIFTGFQWGFLSAKRCIFFHFPMIPPVSLVLSHSQLERPMEGLEWLLPSPCSAFSQSLSIDSIFGDVPRRTFSLGPRDPDTLTARNNGA